MSGFAGKLQRFISENVPWFLQGPNGGAFLEAVGLTLDLGTQTLITGIRQSNPLKAFVDNLPYIGADRGIKRYPTEPVQSYRARLQRWRQIRHYAGTHYGQMISLAPYFLPGAIPRIRTVHQDGLGASATWHTLEADGAYSVHRATPSNWQWDTSPGSWSRFWVIVYIDTTIAPLPEHWDDGGLWDDGHIWDGYYTSAQIDDMIAIINDSKAAHSTLAGLIFATDPASFDPTLNGPGYPDGTWGSVIDPATNLPTRLATAIYAYDNGAP